MKKKYFADTALILEDEDGREYRVEAGEAVYLTEEQFQDLAAHVFAGVEEEPEPAAEDDSGNGGQHEEPEADAAQEKPKRGRSAKAGG